MSSTEELPLQRHGAPRPGSPRRWAGYSLLLVGVLCLLYGGLNQSRDGHRASLGAEAAPGSRVTRIALPFWLGGGIVLVGGMLVLWPLRR